VFVQTLAAGNPDHEKANSCDQSGSRPYREVQNMCADCGVYWRRNINSSALIARHCRRISSRL